MDPILRPGTIEDVPAVAAVRAASWRAAYPGIVPAGLIDRIEELWPVAQHRERFVTAGAAGIEQLVAVVDGAIVGFGTSGAYRPSHDLPGPTGAGEVMALYLHPDRWGDGVGRALLVAMLDRLADRGLDPVLLWTFTGNARARRFYERHGFVADGVVADYRGPDGSLTPELRYRRPPAG